MANPSAGPGAPWTDRKRHVLALVFFVLATVVLTYPLAFRIASSAPDYGDSQHIAWVIAWDSHALLTHPRGLFDTNSFYPYRNTLAYSEHHLGSALLGLPIWLITREPLIVLNLLTLFSFVVLGWGTYLLAYHHFRHLPAALTAGIAAAFVALRFAHLVHLHLLAIQWVPFVFLLLDRYLVGRRRRDLIWFAVFYFLQMLTTMQMGAFVTLALGFYLVVSALARRAPRRLHLWPALAVAGCLLALTPLFRPYLHAARQTGLVRTEAESAFFSAKPIDFLTPTEAQTFYRWLHGLGVGGPLDRWDEEGPLYLLEHTLFAGLALTALAALGAVVWRQGRPVWLTLAVAMWVLSLGVRVGSVPMPYWLVHHVVPGFSGIRAISRFSLLGAFAMAVLAGAAVRWLWSRPTPGARAVLIGGLALLAAESLCVPVPLVEMHLLRDAPPVYQRLAGMPGEFPIVELPMGRYLRGKWYPIAPYPEGPRLYYSALHWKRLVNGYSGHAPRDYPARASRMNRFPAPEVWDELRALGVRWVVVHLSQYPEAMRQPIYAAVRAMPGAEFYGPDILVPVPPH